MSKLVLKAVRPVPSVVAAKSIARPVPAASTRSTSATGARAASARVDGPGPASGGRSVPVPPAVAPHQERSRSAGTSTLSTGAIEQTQVPGSSDDRTVRVVLRIGTGSDISCFTDTQWTF
jgi:hypothetical protein